MVTVTTLFNKKGYDHIFNQIAAVRFATLRKNLVVNIPFYINCVKRYYVTLFEIMFSYLIAKKRATFILFV